MAFNNGFPMGYQYYQQPMPQMMTQQMPQMQQMPQQMTPQVQQQTVQQPQYPVVQGGFVRVRNENEARMYPVAPGNSVTFIDEVAPYCYTKTVNMGQLDRPIFEKYRLVKEDDASQAVEAPNKAPEATAMDLSKYALAADVAAFKKELEAFRADIDTFRGDLYGLAGKKKTPAKKEVATDE